MVYGNLDIEQMINMGFIKNTYNGAVNPASINLRLGDTFKRINENQSYIKLGEEVKYDNVPVVDNHVVIHPGEFMLATTMEWVKVPMNAVAFVQGRSSIGRAGLSVQNAGFVDPAFEGHITLELLNEGPVPIVLYVGYPVVQLVYIKANNVSKGYDGKYKGQIEATGSMMQKDIYKPGNYKEE